jgi:Flp pilus assembly protein TadD
MNIPLHILLLASLVPIRLFPQPARDLKVEMAGPPHPLRGKGDRWAVVIGISEYEHLPAAAQLRFAHRDAEEFAGFLRSAAGGAVPNDHVRFLTNQQATLAEIRAAVHTWLVASARPEDVVYFFFAGHGVLDDHDDGYFVAHDSDPQNLHATALSFQEVDRTLSYQLRAKLVILVADACHTGRLGWSSYSPNTPSRAAGPLEKIGQGDRSFLKLLAASPSESSFEDEQWGGGHGVFTHVLLNGLRGEANRDNDDTIEASEAIDYVSRLVPDRTEARQHPRVAGTFDANVPLAFFMNIAPVTAKSVSLDVSGPPSSAVYVDNVFRGQVRNSGSLRIEALAPGPHAFSADFLDGATLEGTITLGAIPARVTIASPNSTALAQLRSRMNAAQVLEPGGAWDFYRNHAFPAADQAAATALISGALEGLGQACVNDYVQSTAMGPKQMMLRRAVDAYDRLRTLRPNDAGLRMRGLFCQGRLQIAQERFPEAVVTLENTLKLDSRFACAYNALGVAYGRLNRPKEARQAFETAATLTPEWALPPFQIASQLIATGDVARARPYLEKAVAYNPRSVSVRWTLLHVDRLLKRIPEAQRQAAELIRLNPGYAPAYFELGLVDEAAGNLTGALEAYSTYVQLAPNYADTNEVRQHAEQIRRR